MAYFTIQSKETTSVFACFKGAEDGRYFDERNKENVDFMCGQDYDTGHRKHVNRPKTGVGDSKEERAGEKVLLRREPIKRGG